MAAFQFRPLAGFDRPLTAESPQLWIARASDLVPGDVQVAGGLGLRSRPYESPLPERMSKSSCSQSAPRTCSLAAEGGARVTLPLRRASSARRSACPVMPELDHQASDNDQSQPQSRSTHCLANLCESMRLRRVPGMLLPQTRTKLPASFTYLMRLSTYSIPFFPAPKDATYAHPPRCEVRGRSMPNLLIL